VLNLPFIDVFHYFSAKVVIFSGIVKMFYRIFAVIGVNKRSEEEVEMDKHFGIRFDTSFWLE
jgi:hypothetical protein